MVLFFAKAECKIIWSIRLTGSISCAPALCVRGGFEPLGGKPSNLEPLKYQNADRGLGP